MPGAPAVPVARAVSLAPPLPACTYVDTVTPLRAYSAWRSVIVDTRLALPRSYVPPDLVSTGLLGDSGERLRAIVMPDLRAMVRTARAAGVRIRVGSGYRSYAEQVTMYRDYVARLGVAAARIRVARPGHSEHQLGTALDLAYLSSNAWAAAHAWQFGFVISYPRNAIAVTCYRYEPWHLRYVGRARAAAVHASGLALRVWLWLHVPAARA